MQSNRQLFPHERNLLGAIQPALAKLIVEWVKANPFYGAITERGPARIISREEAMVSSFRLSVVGLSEHDILSLHHRDHGPVVSHFRTFFPAVVAAAQRTVCQ